MANKIVSLLLQVKNKISPGANKAAEDLRKLEDRARGLEGELARFESAQAAVRSLDDARRAAQLAESAFDDAQSEVIRLKAELKTSKTPELALALEKARVAAGEARREWTASKKAVTSLEKSIKRAGIEIDDAAAAEKKLADSVEYVNGKIKANNQQLDRARKKLGQTGEAARSAGSGIGSLAGKIAGLVGAAVIIDKIKDGFVSMASSVFEVGGQFELLSKRLSAGELGYIEEFTRNTPLQLDGVSEAFIRLRAFGLDPTTGAMQALVDQNAALGGGQAELEGIINAVGQAWAKQKLQGEEILQLVERGVPAWDLLAKATGKSTVELQRLSEQGKLGRREIKLLIDEIARANEGEAAAAMDSLAGQVSNLKDEVTAFYRRVADNGALDSLKNAIASVRAEIAAMADDGRLERMAAGLSNFFSQTIEWSRRAAGSLDRSFGNIVGTAQLITNSIAVVFNGLRAGVTGSVSLVASAVAKLSGLAGFDDFASKAGFVAESFSSAFDSAADDVRKNGEGISSALDKFGRDFEGVASQAAGSVEGVGESAEGMSEDVSKSSKTIVERLGDIAQGGEDVGDKVSKGASDARVATEELNTEVEKGANDTQAFAAGLAQWFTGVRNELQSLSAEAGALFDSKLGIQSGPILDEIGTIQAGIESAQESIRAAERDNLRLFDPSGVIAWQNSVSTAAAEVKIAFADQKLQAIQLQESLADGGRLNESFLRSAELSIRNMDLLGQQDLSGLRSALDSANQKLQQMNQQSQTTLDNLQNELDRLQGNQDAIAERDYQRKRDELNDAIETAKRQGNQEAIRNYTEALQVLEQVRREQKEQQFRSNSSGSSATNSTPPSSVQAQTVRTVNVNIGSRSVAVLEGDEQDLLQSLTDIAERS